MVRQIGFMCLGAALGSSPMACRLSYFRIPLREYESLVRYLGTECLLLSNVVKGCDFYVLGIG